MKAELDVTKTVKKSNILNELRNANASLIEYRLFCVYLAHIPMNSDDNVVKFSLADYAKIAGLDRPRYLDLKAQAENIVGMTATIENGEGGFSVYSLFSEFKLFKEDEQWMVSLECNAKIAPKIREQRGRFLRYKLYNTIYLKSYNQQRIYELLKQYERIGARAIDLADLRAYLSIGDNEYPVWGDFSQKVLKVAQKALRENTDIYFEYAPIKKKGKVVAVRFDIYKNHSFIDQLRIDDFLPPTEFDEASYEGEALDVRSESDGELEQLTIDDYIDRSEDLDEQHPKKHPEDEIELEQSDVFEQLEAVAAEEVSRQATEQLDVNLFREFLRDGGKEFTYNQIKEQITAARMSNFARSLMFKVDPDMLIVELKDYVEAQEGYVRARSNKPNGLHGYLVKALREDHAEYYRPEDEEEHNGFETDDFFAASLERTKRQMKGS